MNRTLLLVAVLTSTALTFAQPTPSAVEVPGGKGPLPQMADIAPAREGEIPILTLSHVGFSPTIINGHVDIEANLSFPMVEEVGCEYYTAQYKAHGATEWETMKSGGETWQISERSVGICPDIYYVTDYRLVLHGGEKDGLVSNTVTAKPLGMASRYTGWSESPSVEHCMVGIPIGESFTFSAETYKDGNITSYSVEENPDNFRYQWYRNNPSNGDREPIRGATDRIYTPQPEDIGYQLVLEVSGDKEHLDFYLYHPFNGDVCVPVQACPTYLGSDGFILNTDYIIPEPQKMFVQGESWMEDAPVFNPSCISEVAPGQYMFRLPEEEYNYCIFELANPGYFLTFIYKDIWGDGEDWYREVQIMTDRYKGMLTVKVQQDGSPAQTTIDVIGKNIDGDWGVVASGEVNAETGEAVFEQNWETDTDTRIFCGEYYVKARATASTMETYYPATPLWMSATLVDITDESAWDPKLLEINLLPMPAPLAGTGVIEGTVNTDQPAVGRRKAAGAQAGIIVYLLDDAGNVVAQTSTDDGGKYRFENVPFGSYTVLPNIDGYNVEAPTEVTLSTESPTISDVDYTVTDDTVIPTVIPTTAASNTTIQSVWSISGCLGATHGLNIVRMSDGTAKKIIMK